jgi:MoaA/NifB/PqqE/SkfB family radical SAM enzyme
MKLSDALAKLAGTRLADLPAKAAGYYRQRVRHDPVHIILQTVTGCNLACRHCFLHTAGAAGAPQVLSYNTVRGLIDRILGAVKQAEYFQFTVFEPFLQPDLLRLMDYLLTLNPRLKFPLHTNGMLLTDETIRALETRPISECNVSLDGATRPTVEAFKTGVDFDRVVRVIRRLAASRLRPVLSTVLVLHKHNFHELPDYVDFVHSLGVGTIYVNHLLPFSPEFQDWCLYSRDGNPAVAALFKQTVARVRKNGQTIWLPSLRPQKRGCAQCWALFIDQQGEVFPCDLLSAPTSFTCFGQTKTVTPQSYGNILRDDAVQIYQSPALKAFRKQHQRGGHPPDACTHCIDAYSLLCSNRKKYA